MKNSIIILMMLFASIAASAQGQVELTSVNITLHKPTMVTPEVKTESTGTTWPLNGYSSEYAELDLNETVSGGSGVTMKSSTIITNEDCRTKVCYQGYKLVEGFKVDFFNKATIPTRYDVFYPNGDSVRTHYQSPGPHVMYHIGKFARGIIRLRPVDKCAMPCPLQEVISNVTMAIPPKKCIM